MVVSVVILAKTLGKTFESFGVIVFLHLANNEYHEPKPQTNQNFEKPLKRNKRCVTYSYNNVDFADF